MSGPTVGGRKVLIGCTGSVAAIKVPILVQELVNIDDQLEIKVVATEKALNFFDHKSLQIPVLTEADEWKDWKTVSDPILHIELRRWADLMVIAPLDANTLAKLTHGICDNLLTCVIRAWDLKRPLLFAPAMNTHMWNHPLTSQQIDKLKSFGYKEIPCIRKKLACGDDGFGAMAEVSTIVTKIMDIVHSTVPLT
ncbi:phosphopantothenoylcysteine decarboxylase-like [Mytilus galloprovincialis]|uniref:phosphopantothenoylcysteine decarboxylase-like n=1 Tax=Mytilus galloprovincialis TaxID=29158 RepID=UPI003F7B53AA